MPDINDVNYQLTTAANVKFDPSDAAPDYIGMNTNPDAADGDGSWVIYKFTYSSSAITQVRKKIGTWTGRVALLT